MLQIFPCIHLVRVLFKFDKNTHENKFRKCTMIVKKRIEWTTYEQRYVIRVADSKSLYT